MQANAQLVEMIQSFAKANKISRAKLQEFTEQIIQTLPKANKETGKVGRPMLEKTSALHSRIIEAINNGRQGQRDAVTVRKVVSVDYPGLDKVTFNNALSALVKQGKIFHAGKAKTGSRGRRPFILSTVKGGVNRGNQVI